MAYGALQASGADLAVGITGITGPGGALAGEPGEFVAVVRRAGENYFLGAATAEQPRTLSLPLDFL